MDKPADQNCYLARKLVRQLLHPEGDKTLRRVHTLGVGAKGYFTASPVAHRYCCAPHFVLYPDGTPHAPRTTPVTVRFSNASGSAIRHDAWSDVRGMATRFQPEGTDPVDLVAMTLPEFFTATPEDFSDFAKEAYPRAFKRESPWLKIYDYLRLMLPLRNPYPDEKVRPDEGAIRYADKYAVARLGVFQGAAIGAPRSYLRAAYHAVHTFFVTGSDGVRRPVRFTWQPIDGVQNIDLADPKDEAYLTRNYLEDALEDRLSKDEPSRFSLMMVIGETGDDFDNCSKPWPPHRVRVNMGTLALDTAMTSAADREAIERLRFNPWNLPPEIEASGDPVLKIREAVYKIGSKSRLVARGPAQCPFSGS